MNAKLLAKALQELIEILGEYDEETLSDVDPSLTEIMGELDGAIIRSYEQAMALTNNEGFYVDLPGGKRLAVTITE